MGKDWRSESRTLRSWFNHSWPSNYDYWWKCFGFQVSNVYLFLINVFFYNKLKYKLNLFNFSVATEVWEMTEVWGKLKFGSKIINPSLPDGHFASGIALFPVDFNFCKK